MQLGALIREIENSGFSLTGDRALLEPVLCKEVLLAPAVLIPSEPPVQSECVMIANYLSDKRPLDGYVRVEARAMVEHSAACETVHLQFVRVAAKAGRA